MLARWLSVSLVLTRVPVEEVIARHSRDAVGDALVLILRREEKINGRFKGGVNEDRNHKILHSGRDRGRCRRERSCLGTSTVRLDFTQFLT